MRNRSGKTDAEVMIDLMEQMLQRQEALVASLARLEGRFVPRVDLCSTCSGTAAFLSGGPRAASCSDCGGTGLRMQRVPPVEVVIKQGER